MGRIAGSSGPKTMEAICKAGLDLIYEHGYEGTSLRQLAAVVGIQQGSLYNHLRSKQDLLVHLYEEHMGRLLDALDAALDELDRPSDRLRAFVAFHVGYHIERKREVFVVNSELRSLEPENHRRATGMRKQYERRLIEILLAGAAEGTFSVADAPVTAYGILGMLSGVCTWYDEAGRLDAATLSAIYSDLVMKSVGASAPSPHITQHEPAPPANTTA